MKRLLLAPFLILSVSNASIASNRNLNLYIDNFKPKFKQPDETSLIKTAKKLDKKVRQGSIENTENPWYD